MQRPSERARYGRALVLLVLVAVSAARIPYAAVHMDLARDMFIAWRSLHGEALPLSGPVLAGAIHLGPIWYWLLTALLAVGRSWYGAMLLLGVLAGLQFPLAYLTGKELHSCRAGMLWACLLLVPSWSAFEWVLPLHYLLSSTCVLAFLLCAARYWHRPRRRYLVGVALFFVLALHAHPANAGLAWIGIALLVWALRHRHCRGRDVLIAAGVGLLPLLPYFTWDATQGFADLSAGARFLGGEHTGHIAAVLPLLAAATIGGTHYWFAVMLDWAPWAANLTVSVIAGVGLLGFFGALVATFAPHTRRIGLAAFGAAAAIAVTIALLRDMTPYYMTTPLRIVLTGIVALGLAALDFGIVAAAARVGACVFAGASFLICGMRAAHLQKHGDWPFSFFPLFDVTQTVQPTVPLLLMPTYGVAASGRFLCAAPAPSAHGAFAQYLLHGYAVDMRLACGRSDVELGGAEPGRQHWLGLSRAIFARIGVEPQGRLGSIGIVAAHPLSGAAAIVPPALPVYPAYVPKLSPVPEEHRIHLDASGLDASMFDASMLDAGVDRYVAVSNIAFGFAPDPQVLVTVAGKTLEPAAADSVSRVYAIGTAADVEISIRSLDAAEVDVVMF